MLLNTGILPSSRVSIFQGYDQWGKKAYEAFKNVQGKGFRHQKLKKKRGTYSGGEINREIHSIRFDSDSG